MAEWLYWTLLSLRGVLAVFQLAICAWLLSEMIPQARAETRRLRRQSQAGRLRHPESDAT